MRFPTVKVNYLFPILLLLNCKSEPRKVIQSHAGKDTISEIGIKRDTSAIDLHDPYETGKDTIRLNAVMDKIFKFPEVEEINKQISKASRGKYGVAIMVRDEFHGDTTCYNFEVGDNFHEDRYINIFNFIFEKKSGQIKVYDSTTDSIISLKAWRKKR